MSGAYSLLGDEPVFIVREREDAFVLELVPDPTLASYESKQHEYNRIYRRIGETANPKVVFDFSHVHAFDPVLLGMLIELTQRSRALGGNSALAGMSAEMNRLFARLMRLQPINKRCSWEMFGGLDQAIQAWPWECVE